MESGGGAGFSPPVTVGGFHTVTGARFEPRNKLWDAWHRGASKTTGYRGMECELQQIYRMTAESATGDSVTVDDDVFHHPRTMMGRSDSRDFVNDHSESDGISASDSESELMSHRGTEHGTNGFSRCASTNSITAPDAFLDNTLLAQILEMYRDGPRAVPPEFTEPDEYGANSDDEWFDSETHPRGDAHFVQCVLEPAGLAERVRLENREYYCDHMFDLELKLALWTRRHTALGVRFPSSASTLETRGSRTGSFILSLGDPKYWEIILPSRSGSSIGDLKTIILRVGGKQATVEITDELCTATNVRASIDERLHHDILRDGGVLCGYLVSRDANHPKIVEAISTIRSGNSILPLTASQILPPVLSPQTVPCAKGAAGVSAAETVDPTLSGASRVAVRTICTTKPGDVTVIWGPWGTGKSRCIAAAIDAFPGTVHFVSGKNDAVNAFTRRLSRGTKPVLKFSSKNYLDNPRSVVLSADFEKIATDLAGDAPASEFGEYLRSRRTVLETRRQRRSVPEKLLRDFARTRSVCIAALIEIIESNSGCVASTATNTTAVAQADFSADLCVVDEAANEMETNLIIPLATAKAAVLVGDHHQLPPTILATRPLSKRHIPSQTDCSLNGWEPTVEDLSGNPSIPTDFSGISSLEVSLFERLVRCGICNPVFLDKQYRCPRAIGSFLSEHVYNGMLENGPGAPTEALFIIEPEWFMVEIESDFFTRGDPLAKVPNHSANAAAAAAEVYCEMRSKGLAHEDIIILSTYKPVPEMISGIAEACNAIKPTTETVEFCSIDSFQGGERQFVIILLLGPCRGVTGFSGDVHRINTILSRCQSGCAIIADPSTFTTRTPILVELNAAVTTRFSGRDAVVLRRDLRERLSVTAHPGRTRSDRTSVEDTTREAPLRTLMRQSIAARTVGNICQLSSTRQNVHSGRFGSAGRTTEDDTAEICIIVENLHEDDDWVRRIDPFGGSRMLEADTLEDLLYVDISDRSSTASYQDAEDAVRGRNLDEIAARAQVREAFVADRLDPFLFGDLNFDFEETTIGGATQVAITRNGGRIFVGPPPEVSDCGAFTCIINCTASLPIVATPAQIETENVFRVKFRWGDVAAFYNVIRLRRALEWVARKCSGRSRILFHCKYGKHRSAMAAKAFLWLVSPEQKDTIWAQMHKKRPIMEAVFPKLDSFFTTIFTMRPEHRWRTISDEVEIERVYRDLITPTITRKTPGAHEGDVDTDADSEGDEPPLREDVRRHATSSNTTRNPSGQPVDSGDIMIHAPNPGDTRNLWFPSRAAEFPPVDGLRGTGIYPRTALHATNYRYNWRLVSYNPESLMKLLTDRHDKHATVIFNKWRPDECGFCETKLSHKTEDTAGDLIRTNFGYETTTFRNTIVPGQHGTSSCRRPEHNSITEAGRGIGREGRCHHIVYPRFIVVHVYLPNRVEKEKFCGDTLKEFDQRFLGYIRELPKRYARPLILAGDFNLLGSISDASSHPHVMQGARQMLRHTPVLSALDDMGLIDTFLSTNPTASGHFSHFHPPYGLHKRNHGMRIDKILVHNTLVRYVKHSYIIREILKDEGDHHPVGCDFEFPTEFFDKSANGLCGTTIPRFGGVFAPPITDAILAGAKEEHVTFMELQNRAPDDSFIGEVFLQALRHVDMELLESEATTRGMTTDEVRQRVECFCMVWAVRYSSQMTMNGFKLFTFNIKPFGVELLNFLVKPREPRPRIRSSPDEDLLCGYLAEQAVLATILKKHDAATDGFYNYLNAGMRAPRANMHGGRLVYLLLGPNDMAFDAACYSIIPQQILETLFSQNTKAYNTDDIKHAFAGIPIAPALALWLAVVIGTQVYLTKRAVPGFKAWPRIFNQIVAGFQQLRVGPHAVEKFWSEFGALSQETLVPLLREHGLLNITANVNLAAAAMDSATSTARMTPGHPRTNCSGLCADAIDEFCDGESTDDERGIDEIDAIGIPHVPSRDSTEPAERSIHSTGEFGTSVAADLRDTSSTGPRESLRDIWIEQSWPSAEVLEYYAAVNDDELVTGDTMYASMHRAAPYNKPDPIFFEGIPSERLAELEVRWAHDSDSVMSIHCTDTFFDTVDDVLTRGAMVLRKRRIRGGETSDTRRREEWSLYDGGGSDAQKVSGIDEVFAALRARFNIIVDNPRKRYGGVFKQRFTSETTPLREFAEAAVSKQHYRFHSQQKHDFSYNIIVHQIRVSPMYWSSARQKDVSNIATYLVPVGVVEIDPLSLGKDSVDDVALSNSISAFRTATTPFHMIMECVDPLRIPHLIVESRTQCNRMAVFRTGGAVQISGEPSRKRQRPDDTGFRESDEAASPPSLDERELWGADPEEWGEILRKLRQDSTGSDTPGEKLSQDEILTIYKALLRDVDHLGLPKVIREAKSEKGEKILTDAELLSIHVADNHRPAASLSMILTVAGYRGITTERVQQTITTCTCRGVRFNRYFPKKKASLEIPSRADWQVDLFFLPFSSGTVSLGGRTGSSLREMPEHDSDELLKQSRKVFDKAAVEPYEMVCSSTLDSLTVAGRGGDALLFKFENFIRTKPQSILVSDSHRRGSSMFGWESVRTEVPLTPFWAPDQSTAVVGPLSYLFRAIWYDNHDLVSGKLHLGRPELLEFVNTRMNCLPGNQVNLTWLLPGRQSQHLLDRAILGLADMFLVKALIQPKVQRMLRSQKNNNFGLMAPVCANDVEQVVCVHHPAHGIFEGLLNGDKGVLSISAGGRLFPVNPRHCLWEKSKEASRTSTFFGIFPPFAASKLALLVGEWESIPVAPLRSDIIDGPVRIEEFPQAIRTTDPIDFIRIRNINTSLVALRVGAAQITAPHEAEWYTLDCHSDEKLRGIIVMTHTGEHAGLPLAMYGHVVSHEYLYFQFNSSVGVQARVWIRQVSNDTWRGNARFRTNIAPTVLTDSMIDERSSSNASDHNTTVLLFRARLMVATAEAVQKEHITVQSIAVSDHGIRFIKHDGRQLYVSYDAVYDWDCLVGDRSDERLAFCENLKFCHPIPRDAIDAVQQIRVDDPITAIAEGPIEHEEFSATEILYTIARFTRGDETVPFTHIPEDESISFFRATEGQKPFRPNVLRVKACVFHQQRETRVHLDDPFSSPTVGTLHNNNPTFPPASGTTDSRQRIESKYILADAIRKGRILNPQKFRDEYSKSYFIGKGIRSHHVADRVMIFLAKWSTPDDLPASKLEDCAQFIIPHDVSAITDTGDLCGPEFDLEGALQLLEQEREWKETAREIRAEPDTSRFRICHGSISTRTFHATDGPRVVLPDCASHAVAGFTGSAIDRDPVVVLVKCFVMDADTGLLRVLPPMALYLMRTWCSGRTSDNLGIAFGNIDLASLTMQMSPCTTRTRFTNSSVSPHESFWVSHFITLPRAVQDHQKATLHVGGRCRALVEHDTTRMAVGDFADIVVPLPFDLGQIVLVWLSKEDDIRAVLLLGNTYGPIVLTVTAQEIVLRIEAVKPMSVTSVTICMKEVSDENQDAIQKRCLLRNRIQRVLKENLARGIVRDDTTPTDGIVRLTRKRSKKHNNIDGLGDSTMESSDSARIASHGISKTDPRTHQNASQSSGGINTQATPPFRTTHECFGDDAFDGNEMDDDDDDTNVPISSTPPPLQTDALVRKFVTALPAIRASLDACGALELVTKYSNADYVESLDITGAEYFIQMMMDDATAAVQSVGDGFLKKLLVSGKNEFLGSQFGNPKSKFLCASEKVCGYMCVRGSIHVPESRVNDIVNSARIPPTPRLLKRMLCKMAFFPQMLLTRHFEPLTSLGVWTRKSQAEYMQILDDETAMRALQLIIFCSSINPLAPVDVDGVLSGRRILFGMPDACETGWGAILMSMSTEAYSKTDTDGADFDLRSVMTIHAVKSATISPELRGRCSAFSECTATVGYYQHIDYAYSKLPRVWCSDSDNIVSVSDDRHRCGEKAFLTLLGLTRRFLEQPLLTRLHAGSPWHIFDDAASRVSRNTVIATSTMQQRMTKPKEMLRDLFPQCRFDVREMEETGTRRRLSEEDRDAFKAHSIPKA